MASVPRHLRPSSFFFSPSPTQRFNGQFDRNPRNFSGNVLQVLIFLPPSSGFFSLAGHFRSAVVAVGRSRPRKWYRCAARRETVIEEEINSFGRFCSVVLVSRLTPPFRYEWSRPISIFRSRESTPPKPTAPTSFFAIVKLRESRTHDTILPKKFCYRTLPNVLCSLQLWIQTSIFFSRSTLKV